MKKILIIGSGGREHALAWKLAQSPQVGTIYCAPGNAGTALVGKNVSIRSEDIPGLIAFARTEQIDLTVVGPDDALAAGMVDAFQTEGLRIFGPTAAAARLESSKAFAKDFMRRHGIPTAESREFTDSLEAYAWCRSAEYPLVIKADGLALGKGVVIAASPAEAALAIYRSMDQGIFGDSGRKIIIEDYLEGPECSIHALIDGESYLLFPEARDHKRALDGNRGLNTGGMGTISPTGDFDAELTTRVKTEILDRFVAGLQADGISFQGMLFPGLMLTAGGPKVLEFNCRFGDPETQVLMRRLQGDLLDLLEATVDGTLASCRPSWDGRTAVCIIMASGGYPGPYEKGLEIHGLRDGAGRDGVVVFHAGTKTEGAKFVTNGGRVLGVSALGKDLNAARQSAYEAVEGIHFDGRQFRKDIGVA